MFKSALYTSINVMICQEFCISSLLSGKQTFVGVILAYTPWASGAGWLHEDVGSYRNE